MNITWLKDQTIISSLTHDIQYERGLATLTLVDVQREDSAYYTCRADNIAGTMESSAYLIVKGILKNLNREKTYINSKRIIKRSVQNFLRSLLELLMSLMKTT
jgi:hypothetical protein